MTQNKTPWRAGNRHILQDASLAPDPEGDDVLPHPLAIARSAGSIPQTAGGLEEGGGQMERKGRAVTLLPGFEVIEEPTDVGEEQIEEKTRFGL
jgi:hypothetical protein